jgi:hypothetical protein
MIAEEEKIAAKTRQARRSCFVFAARMQVQGDAGGSWHNFGRFS